MMMNVIPGLLIAFALAVAGNFLADRLALCARARCRRYQRHHGRHPAGSRARQPAQAAGGAEAGHQLCSEAGAAARHRAAWPQAEHRRGGFHRLQVAAGDHGHDPCRHPDRDVSRPSARPARPARHAHRGRHQHLRQHRHRRGLTNHRREGRGDQLCGRVHHGVRPLRDARLSLRRALAVWRRRVQGRAVPRLIRARHVAGGGRGHGVFGLLPATRRRSTSPRSPSSNATCRCCW